MIRRPLDVRFCDALLDGRKVTTIRDKAWPLGVPVMLYHWTGKPYRSKQVDVAAVKVEMHGPVHIFHRGNGDMEFLYVPRIFCNGRKLRLWEAEGFSSVEGLGEWFRPLVKRGDFATMRLMRFRLWKEAEG